MGSIRPARVGAKSALPRALPCRTFMNHAIFKETSGFPAMLPSVHLVDGAPFLVGTQASDLLQALPAVHLQPTANVVICNFFQHESAVLLNVKATTGNSQFLVFSEFVKYFC